MVDERLGFDPRRDDVIDDPMPWYAWLRGRERAYAVAGGEFYAVSRYDDVLAVTKNHAVFSSTGGIGLAWGSHPMMSMMDPPEHTRLRRIVSSAFTPSAVRALHPALVEATRTRLAELRGSTFDFVGGLAEPLAARVISDLLGLPHALEERFRGWSLAIVGTLAGNLSGEATEADRRELVRAMRSLVGTPRGIYAVLSAANQSERLTENELVAFCVLLLVAGFETSVNGMANIVGQLLAHPEELDRMRRDPARRTKVVEEALRLDPPDHAFFRNTLSEATFADGSVVPPGKKVMVVFASANHDEAQFPEPSRFDPDRSNLAHVAFGHGVHYCLGAPLARSLYDVVLGELADAGLRLEPAGPPERTRNSMLRGFLSLPVRLSD